MASVFLLRPTLHVPERALEALENLCVVQSQQSFVTGLELETRLRDVRKWWRLDRVSETSEICSTFLDDSCFRLLGKYLTRTLNVMEVADFLRLYVVYLAPFHLTLPEPHEFGDDKGLIHGMADRNLRMFVEAFSTIYGHYSIHDVASCVKIDIDMYLREACHLNNKIVFPRLGSVVFDTFGRVLSYLPRGAGLWPNYAPQRTVCQNL